MTSLLPLSPHPAARPLLRITRREVALVALLGFMAYLVAEELGLSGIFSVFFAGITMSHYTWHSLSPSGKVVTGGSWGGEGCAAEAVAPATPTSPCRLIPGCFTPPFFLPHPLPSHAPPPLLPLPTATVYLFRIMSFASELFLVLYAGFSMWSSLLWEPRKAAHAGALAVGLVAQVLVARAVVLVPLVALANTWRPRSSRIRAAQAVVVWWAGSMRGAGEAVLQGGRSSGVCWEMEGDQR